MLKFESYEEGLPSVLEGDIYFVSYSKTSHLDFMSDEPETALVVDTLDNETRFYILIGDFRKEFTAAANESGMEGCLELYRQLIEHRSPHSGDEEFYQMGLH